MEQIDEIEEILVMITEKAEKIFKEFNMVTANEFLRDAFTQQLCLNLQKLMSPDDAKLKIFEAQLRNRIYQLMAIKATTNEIVTTGK